MKVFIVEKGFEDHELRVLKEIVDSLVSSKEDLREKVEIVELPEFREEQGIMIISQQVIGELNPERSSGQLFIMFKGGLESNIVKFAQRMGVVGIFPIDRFFGERMEYGEISRFENVLKNVLRDRLSTRFPEWNFKKRIDWKVKLENSFEDSEENAYISLFGDEITHRNVKKTNEIITSVRAYAKELKIFRNKAKKTLEALEKQELSEDPKLEGARIAIRKLNDLTSEMKFRKPVCILLTGPTGCGKTLLAKYISNSLFGSLETFSRISLVNMGDNLLESELFGNFPGSWTGSSYKVGKMVSMAGGAVFLDEIGEISPAIQAKLLTYLDDMKVLIEGLSDTSGVKVPVLIIAATNRDVRKEMSLGNFRSDFFQRFAYEIHMPSLSERKSDFRYILSHLLQVKKKILNLSIDEISIAAIEKLEGYEYPGNYRELERVVTAAMMSAKMDGREIVLSRDVQF
ncbi:Sigma 54 interacting domain protein [Mesotoga infera]|nr:Sigma 54 interacting domain protein [Mesotoga infera]